MRVGKKLKQLAKIILFVSLFITLFSFNITAEEEDPGDTTDPGTALAGDPEEGREVGDFYIIGPEENYELIGEVTADPYLLIKGDLSIRNRDGVDITNQHIVVDADAKIVLNGINITAKYDPAIRIVAPHTVTLNLKQGSENTVVGGHGVDINHTTGSWSGIEVEFRFEESEKPANVMASLIIEGEGVLNATGYENAAGIGGSNSASNKSGRGLYGNITINSGTINANASGGGAAIGSSNNPNGGTSIGSFKATGNNKWGTITINGGTINAVNAAGQGAGIGGGNHVDSSKIIINGGEIYAKGAAGIGCGIGSSKHKSDYGAEKGPGYYFADIEINGGKITAESNDIGAAIGGGMYCDARIVITDGEINAIGGSRKEHNTHHGGAGIGGGYLGHADVTISGGKVNATGGDGAAGIGSGGSPNSNSLRGTNGRQAAENPEESVIFLQKTTINISGGEINAKGGPKGGAGIGLGTGGDKASISITGGEIRAEGAKASADQMWGGASIGSGFYGLGTGDAKYFVEADVDITISGEPKVLAIGGWGAAGIGSGAANRMANNIEINVAESADSFVEAYADGTKFAIDTRILDDEGKTTSRTKGREYAGDYLQGTFVHECDIRGTHQNPEGLSSIVLTNDLTGWNKELVNMPAYYRSFASSVVGAGAYTVYTDDPDIGEGEGRYFNVCSKDIYAEDEISGKGVKYVVESDKLSDNFYLFPVKSIVVEKVVEAPEKALSKLNTTVYFVLKHDGEVYADKNGVVCESIDIVNGVAQGKAYFVDMPDTTYDVFEVKGKNDLTSPVGTAFGSTTLKAITTAHGNDLILNSDTVVKDGLSISKHSEGDKLIIEIRKDIGSFVNENQSLTLSLYANGKLVRIADNNIKINKDKLTHSWVVDLNDSNGLISYTIKDTSNNAAISDKKWTDKVTVINTYESSSNLLIRKLLPKEYKFEDYTGSTVIFRIRISDENGQKYENYVGMSLTADASKWDSDAKCFVYERSVNDIPYNEGDEIEVVEIYGAGYEATELKKSESGDYYQFDIRNEYEEFVPGNGAVNIYSKKAYKESIPHEQLDVSAGRKESDHE